MDKLSNTVKCEEIISDTYLMLCVKLNKVFKICLAHSCKHRDTQKKFFYRTSLVFRGSIHFRIPREDNVLLRIWSIHKEILQSQKKICSKFLSYPVKQKTNHKFTSKEYISILSKECLSLHAQNNGLCFSTISTFHLKHILTFH